MRKKLFVVFSTVEILFIILSASAYSSDWLKVETSMVKEEYYIDLDNIRFNRSVVTFWAKNIDRKGETTRTRFSINCEKGTGTIRDIIIYSSDETILKSYSCKDGQLSWRRISPDSFMNDFQKLLCSDKIKENCKPDLDLSMPRKKSLQNR